MTAVGADGAAFGRGDDAGIEPSDDANDEHQDRPDAGKRSAALAPERGTIREGDRRRQRRIEGAADHDHDHVDRGGEQAGENAGDQQLGHRDLGENSVDDESDARRDKRVEGAAAGADTGGEPLVVFVLEHFGHGEARHHRRRGHARARGGAETSAGPVRRDREPARQRTEPSMRRAEQRGTDARIASDGAHQQEHRDRGQVPAGGEHEGRVAERAERDVEITQVPEAEERDRTHRDADRHAQRDEHQHSAKAAQRQRERVHSSPPPRSRPRAVSAAPRR